MGRWDEQANNAAASKNSDEKYMREARRLLQSLDVSRAANEFIAAGRDAASAFKKARIPYTYQAPKRWQLSSISDWLLRRDGVWIDVAFHDGVLLSLLYSNGRRKRLEIDLREDFVRRAVDVDLKLSGPVGTNFWGLTLNGQSLEPMVGDLPLSKHMDLIVAKKLGESR